MKKKKIVISGVNMVDSGILTIFREVVTTFSKKSNVDIICLVNNKELFVDIYNNNVSFVEYKGIKSSWIKRLYFEFVYSFFLSMKLKPDAWVCLHDISANIYNTHQFVYCHNPSPFYSSNWKDWRMDKKFFLFTMFYKYLYRINIRKNKAIIVQQTWMANRFSEWFDVNNIIVSKPEVKFNLICGKKKNTGDGRVRLIYPAVPRVFKNMEALIDAFIYIKNNAKDVYKKTEILLTFDRGMTQYGDEIIKCCEENGLDNIKFIGYQSKADLNDKYSSVVDALIFPSKLETWGLPISEAKMYGLPIIAINMDYAKETVGDYSAVTFFDSNCENSLANVIIKYVRKDIVFEGNASVKSSWHELYNFDELAEYIINNAK
ncbi:glycosyltransferase [Serratia sp. PL7]|uniref:glycosyltransferase n=1 Tax=Serratia sp. PL7 TaxID=2952201 RepID=UPI0019EA170D|nr:glycosyltransferase [Serratia sp. PL7]MBE0153563.1 glycosyltransferase family 4 protein [Serratia fonticola]